MPQNTPLTVDSATSLFSQMLDAEGAEDTIVEETPQEVEVPADDAELETPAEDEVPSDDAEQPEPEPLHQTFKVKINGEETEVTLEEALKGYQRTADYTRKTQELAERRKAFEEHARQVVEERRRYAEALHQLEQVVQVSMQEPDWAAYQQAGLTAEEYAEAVNEYRLQQQRLTQIREEQQRAALAQQQDATRFRAQYLEQEKERLLHAVPEWKDSKKAASEMQEIVQYAVHDLGFGQEEVAQIADHRLFVLLRNAMRYERMSKSKPVAVKPAPPTVKPLPAGTAKSSKPVAQITRDKQRLAKTGSLTDAAKVFEHFID